MAKKPVDPAKAKQAKQKRMVIILSVVFVLAMAYAVNTMMGLNSGGGAKPEAAPPAPVTSTTTPTSTPTSTPTTATAAPTLAGSGTTTTPQASTDSSSLVAVVTPPADPGQLESFSHFSSKDPFDSSGPKTGGASSSGPSSSSSGTSGSSGSSGKSGGGGTSTPKTPPAPPTPPPTTAVLSVNGTEESVASGSDFPAANPIFQLVSLGSTTAQVGIAGGSYATGQATLTLTVNKPVTLVNTADGTRYTLLLLPQGTVPPQSSSSSSGSSSTTPATTTPTTTTTQTTTTSGP